MGNKIRNLLLSGSLLATTAAYATPELPDAEKKETKVENVEDIAKQRALLEEEVKQAEEKLPNAFERGMGKVTSAIREGAGYVAKGISYPIRATGSVLHYAGSKAAEGLSVAGGALGVPSVGKVAGSVLRTPTDIADTALNVAGDVVDRAINISTDAAMTGLDSAATATRDVDEAGRNFAGGMTKATAYVVGDTVKSTGELASTVLGDTVGLVSKGAGNLTHAGGDLADIAIRNGLPSQATRYLSKGQESDNHWNRLDKGKTAQKALNRFEQFKQGIQSEVTPEIINGFSQGKEGISKLVKDGSMQRVASRMVGRIDGALEDAKNLAKEANAESRAISLEDRQAALQKAKDKLEAFEKEHAPQPQKEQSSLKRTLEASQEKAETTRQNTENTQAASEKASENSGNSSALPTQAVAALAQNSK